MLRYELRRHDYYLLQVTSRRDVVLTLESPGINSTLALFTRDGAPVADAMAIGEPGRIMSQLSPGEYVVRVGVGSGNGRETGRYTLRVNSHPRAATRPPFRWQCRVAPRPVLGTRRRLRARLS
jgi:hypothetical protein